MSTAPKLLVISAVNIVSGGTLTILKSFVDALKNDQFSNWKVVALTHPSVSFDFGNVKRINYSLPKRSWLVRIFYEYFVFYFISRRLKPEVWFSLHDITPNVRALKRFVYCHNPSPFYRPPFLESMLDPKFFIFNKFYKYFYSFNIGKNNAVIVQQAWMKVEISKITTTPVHINHPNYVSPLNIVSKKPFQDRVVFFYPAFPRVFKNHQVLCQAIEFINPDVRKKIRIIFTIDGKENNYSRILYIKYAKLNEVHFAGRLSYEETQSHLASSACLLFPSKLETWGLPLTEAKHMGKIVLASDLPYARESLGKYERVRFINHSDPVSWANAITDVALGREICSYNILCESPPDSQGATALLNFMLNDDKN